MGSMELVIIALTGLVLLGVLVLLVALAQRSMAGRRVEERVRTDGELEPIAVLAVDRRPARPAGPSAMRRQAA